MAAGALSAFSATRGSRGTSPDRFGSQEDACQFCRAFFGWYNDEHYHTGIALLTPAMLHDGSVETIVGQRQQVLDAAYAAHPERFVRKPPAPQAPPREVWINPPAKATSPQQPISNPNGSPIEIDRSGPKTELLTSPLTSANNLPRPMTPGNPPPSCNSIARIRGPATEQRDTKFVTQVSHFH